MPRKNKNLIDIVTPGSSDVTSGKKSNKKRLSRKQRSQQFKEQIRKDYLENNVGVEAGYSDATVAAQTELRMLQENKNNESNYLGQTYSETDTHTKDYNYKGKKIDESYTRSRMLQKDDNDKSNFKQGFISYDEFKNLDMGSYKEMGNANPDPKNIFLESYKRRGSNIENENKNLMLRKQGYEELTNKDFKEVFGRSKKEDKKTFNEDLQAAKEKYSTGVFGLGGIKSKSYIVGEENAAPLLESFSNIGKEAKNINPKFKLSSNEFNKITGSKKSKLNFGG
tara:strand:- start:46 stop:888 length:843 start_codon:yes stop_codon:yes gene_type:complete